MADFKFHKMFSPWESTTWESTTESSPWESTTVLQCLEDPDTLKDWDMFDPEPSLYGRGDWVHPREELKLYSHVSHTDVYQLDDYATYLPSLMYTDDQQVPKQADNLDHQTGSLDLQTGNLDNQTGNLDLQTGNLDNQTGNLDLQTGNLDNQTGNLDLQTGNLDNQTGSHDQQIGCPGLAGRCDKLSDQLLRNDLHLLPGRGQTRPGGLEEDPGAREWWRVKSGINDDCDQEVPLWTESGSSLDVSAQPVSCQVMEYVRSLPSYTPLDDVLPSLVTSDPQRRSKLECKDQPPSLEGHQRSPLQDSCDSGVVSTVDESGPLDPMSKIHTQLQEFQSHLRSLSQRSRSSMNVMDSSFGSDISFVHTEDRSISLVSSEHHNTSIDDYMSSFEGDIPISQRSSEGDSDLGSLSPGYVVYDTDSQSSSDSNSPQRELDSCMIVDQLVPESPIEE